MGIAGGAERARRYYQDISTQGVIGTSDTSQDIIAGRPKTVVHIQALLLSISTDAAQNLTIRDTSGAPVTLGLIPNSPGVGVKTFDFGDEGYQLPEGEGLYFALSAAGLGFTYQVIGYRRTVGVMTTAQHLAT